LLRDDQPISDEAYKVQTQLEAQKVNIVSWNLHKKYNICAFS